MNFTYPGILHCFEIDGSNINTLVIENRQLFFALIEDLYVQTEGNDGKAVLSKDYEPIEISKNLEMISDFISFDINKKTIITKIISKIEKKALGTEYWTETQEILARIEKLVEECSFDFSCDLVITKLNLSSLLKAVGIEINNDYIGRVEKAERIIDYMELVREFDREKLFVTVNMRSYFDDETIEKFMNTVVNHEFKLLMIENKAYELLSHEKRYVVDEDLCEF